MKNTPVFLVVLCAALLLASCSKNLSVDEYLASANDLLAEGNNQAALIELKNAVRADPQNPQARLLLGTSYLNGGELQSAEKELQKARENGASDDIVVPLLAEVLQVLGKHAEVLELDAAGLDHTEDRAAVLAVQGISALAGGDVWRASELTEEALATDPDSSVALLAAARLALHDGSIELARQRLGESLEIDPEYAAAWSFQADMERRNGQLQLAEDAYTKAIALARNDSADRLQRALVRIQAGNFEEAQEDLDVLSKRFSQHPGVSYAQGLIQLHRKEMAEAKTSLDAATLAGNSYPLAYFYLASIHAEEGNQAQAQSNADKFLSIAPSYPLARKLSASLKLRVEKYKDAEELLRPVVAAFPDDVAALNLLAASLAGQGKSDESLDILEKVVELQPGSAVARSRLGQGLLSAGNEALGLEYLKAALQLDPKLQQADTTLVLNYLRQRDFEAAIKAGEDYRRRNPAEVAPYNLLGQVYLAARDDENARKAYEQVLKLEPGDPNANHGLAFLAEQAGDTVAARAYYETVLEYRKDYLPTLMKLSALDALEGNEDTMIESLQRAIELHPQAVEPRLVLSRYYLARGRSDLVVGLFNELDDVGRLQPVIAGMLARAELEQKNYSVAKYYLEELVEVQPGVAETHYQLAMAYAGEGDSSKTQAELLKAIEINPDHFPARIALARFLLLQSDTPGLEDQIVELRRIAPDSSDVLQLEGVLSTLKKDPKAALEKMQSAFAGNPSTATLLTLARQQYALGNITAAKSLMREWLDQHESDVSTRVALAELYMLEEDQERAMSEFQLVLETDGRNVVALNNLAWHLRHSDPARALSYAELAAEVNPGSAPVVDTLAMTLLANKKMALAQRTINRAIALNPKDPGQHYHAAQILAASGDKQGAKAILKPLLQTGVSFPEKGDAVRLLAELEQ